MDIKAILLVAITLALSANVNAALIERLGGLAYYDDVADLTWLADANYAQTSGYDANGSMTWQQSMDWATNLNVGGVDGWRLPDTLQPDTSCSSQSANLSYGYNCTGSEMGNLFYNVMGGVASSSIATTHNENYDLFDNIQPKYYWSATEYASFPQHALVFSYQIGSQYTFDKNSDLNDYHAWAVQSGDIGASAVPIPSVIWLFGSGLLALIGVAKRKQV